MVRVKATFEVELPDAAEGDPYELELMAEELVELINNELLGGGAEVENAKVEII